uniref:Large ribosomal subunit protein bL21c n=2 Tax=Alsophila TaxID=86337 RepID=A0A8F7CBJ8_9MONI|nr:ribosomal protein L21 [Alsophila gigantea]YP_010375561.1 ribosomal protein L21 [Alsophila metteniana]QDP70914.1 ribosomal protein L21 [Alsophila gigantea]QXU59540.1 ribosomal protein L21 [Alsophila metteniana]
MNKYAIIDVGGKQLRVEPGRFYDVRHFASIQDVSGSNMKVSINRVSLIRRGSEISIGHPWLSDATVRGRILHPCFGSKLVIQKIHSKRKTRRKIGYRDNLIRFVVDSIYFNGKELNDC